MRKAASTRQRLMSAYATQRVWLEPQHMHKDVCVHTALLHVRAQMSKLAGCRWLQMHERLQQGTQMAQTNPEFQAARVQRTTLGSRPASVTTFSRGNGRPANLEHSIVESSSLGVSVLWGVCSHIMRLISSVLAWSSLPKLRPDQLCNHRPCVQAPAVHGCASAFRLSG